MISSNSKGNKYHDKMGRFSESPSSPSSSFEKDEKEENLLDPDKVEGFFGGPAWWDTPGALNELDPDKVDEDISFDWMENGDLTDNKEAPVIINYEKNVSKTLLNFDEYRKNRISKLKPMLKPWQAQEFNEKMKKIFSHSILASRFKSMYLRTILESDELKNQFGSDHSSGCHDEYIRTRVSRELFGTDTDGDEKKQKQEYEKYGMMFDQNITKSLKKAKGGWYGGCVIIFNKDKMSPFTTFSIGDSLNYKSTCSPQRFNDEQIDEFSICGSLKYSMIGDDDDYSSFMKSKTIDDMCNKNGASAGYPELQFHVKKITISEFAEAIYIDKTTLQNERESLARYKRKHPNIKILTSGIDDTTEEVEF